MEIQRDAIFHHDRYGMIRIEGFDEQIDAWVDGVVYRTFIVIFVELKDSGPEATNLVHQEPIEAFQQRAEPT